MRLSLHAERPSMVWDDRPDWMDEAVCKGHTALFFPPEFERPEARAERELDARTRFCARCPVAGECRAFAREHREFGFWGGESEEARAELGRAPMLAWGTSARIRARVRDEGRG